MRQRHHLHSSLLLLFCFLLIMLPCASLAQELTFPEAEHFETYTRFLLDCTDAGLEVVEYRMEQDIYEMMEQIFFFDALQNVTFSIHYDYPETAFAGYQIYIERGEDAFAGAETMYQALIAATDPSCSKDEAAGLAQALVETLEEEDDGLLMSAVDRGQWRHILTCSEDAVTMLSIPWTEQ